MKTARALCLAFGFISNHSILVSAGLSINNGFHHRLGMHSSGKCKYLPPPASAQVTAPALPLVDTLFAGSTNERAAVPNTGPPCWGVCTPAWPPPSSSHPALRARLSASASNIFAKLTQSLSSIICDSPSLLQTTQIMRSGAERPTILKL